jgi:Cu(I)/Ag(I) efflux system membrane fusion protein
MRKLKWVLYASLPAVAVVAAWYATRQPSQTRGDTTHDHAAMTLTAAQPVQLSAADAQRIGVTYAMAEMLPLGREIRTVGLVTFDETRVRTVSLRVDGWVERLHVNFTGQFVPAGAPLLAIYSPMLVTAQDELLLARRLEMDVAQGSAEARANAASLTASARQRLSSWNIPPDDIARIERTGQTERTLTLHAPDGGFVVEKNVFEGQQVMAGEPLYRLAALDSVWLEGEVFERDLSSVRVGQSVVAEFDAMQGRSLRGVITYVQPTTDAETRTTRVRVTLANQDLRLKPGMYATLRWQGGDARPVLSVPRNAVVSTGERNFVFVQRADGMLDPRIVELGIATAERIEIRRGLASGERVVASATFLVDAESNLGTALGGMGTMPGMDMTAPRKPE